ncbi:hypothetical protein ACROYT_G032125 [Oculina patagonica]
MAANSPANLFPRLILFGDSLTQESFSEGGWGAAIADHYQRKCDVLNRGFSGYTTAFNKLILPKILQCDNSPKGSIVAAVVLLGSNDSVLEDVDPRGITVEQYIVNLTDILKQFMNDGIAANQLVLLTPPAISEVIATKKFAENGWTMSLSDERVKCFAGRCADLGKSFGVDVVDLYTLFRQQPLSSVGRLIALVLGGGVQEAREENARSIEDSQGEPGEIKKIFQHFVLQNPGNSNSEEK